LRVREARLMDRICVIAEGESAARDLRTRLDRFFDAQFFQLDRLPEAAPEQYTLVEIDLRTPGPCYELRNWLKRRPRDSQVIFSVRRDSHAESVQALALGATGLIARPVMGAGLRAKLDEKNRTLSELADGIGLDELPGIGAGVNALYDLFDSALRGGPIDPKAVSAAGEAVVSSIDEAGLGRWVNAVRKHHSQTYQHCLLVTGVAVGFGRHLGFNRVDKQRLATAGLLHDIGKAKIPLEILEKDGPLNADELAIMRQHPLYGLEALQNSPGLQPEMLDMVAHHHEYLDGSGYPHGLQSNAISDLVRTMTISDIYGALIEQRSYKPALDPAAAYDILVGMRDKLDKDLVREFRAIARA
jgi:putative nucleotidyltransferase with HDIG domain